MTNPAPALDRSYLPCGCTCACCGQSYATQCSQCGRWHCVLCRGPAWPTLREYLRVLDRLRWVSLFWD
jgi:hypothetical protein